MTLIDTPSLLAAIGDPSWVLKPISDIKDVKLALIVAMDGMVLGASDGTDRTKAESVAAMTSALQGAARSSSNKAHDLPKETPVHSVTTTSAAGTYMVMPAGKNALVVVVGGPKMPLGVAAQAATKQANKLGEKLMSVGARTDAGTAS